MWRGRLTIAVVRVERHAGPTGLGPALWNDEPCRSSPVYESLWIYTSDGLYLAVGHIDDTAAIFGLAGVSLGAITDNADEHRLVRL